MEKLLEILDMVAIAAINVSLAILAVICIVYAVTDYWIIPIV